ncbi:hypothetical protein M5689_015778 [Euphorbia peplus]|nr:hypothetical protein M5689_015778 [Euphorbia peplus]
MESQIRFSSKVLESARSYRKLLISKVQKKGEAKSENCEKKSEKAKCECRWGDSKPRASRKRKQVWIDGENKENNVSGIDS